MCRSIILFFFLNFCINHFACSQKKPATADSTKLYSNIEAYSKKGKFTEFVHKLIFKPAIAVRPKKAIKKKVYKGLIQRPYSTFEGKKIRHINIVTLDPFGFSIADTIEPRQNALTNSGNALHIKTQSITIRNLLLIHQNQIFDSLLVKESERLVRSQRYINDVSFFVIATAKKSDSVDIYIRELDKWSITPRVAASDSKVTFILRDRNFLGLGHEFQNGYTWYHTTGDDAFNTNYYIPNISNTYISTTLHYGSDEYNNFIKSFSVDRPFFSPFAKWAAGVNIAQNFKSDSILGSELIFVPQRFKFNTQDYWAGYATQIFKGNTERDRTTNFISALRFLRTRYLERPVESLDLQHIYTDENFYLANMGISTRKYVQDKYIFKFGVTEDVPIGKVYSLTGGYTEKNNTGHLYLGARIAVGNYYSWGYISTNFEYGTFFRSSDSKQGVFTVGVDYFTGLIEIGKWKLRQFAKPQLMVGINRLPYESLTLNDGFGINGFNSSSLSGTSRLLFTLQTQSYAPWNFIGFRFGPYINYSLGILGDAASGFEKSRVYSQFGFGVLIKNENLIINTFQISISFYPSIPGSANNMLKVNSFRTTDFGFRDFEIGKPAVVVFQ